jgi:two-component system invasion response regulator UvrY
MIRVLLVDDHTVVRFGFRLLLEAAPDVEVVGEADSGERAYAMYSQCRPDVVIMDLSMPGMGGIEALKRIRLHHTGARLLALSAHDDAMHARRALGQGALGFLSKRSAPEILLEAVRSVASGKRYLDPSLEQELAPEEIDGASETPIERLSEREFEVFLRLARGAAVQTIANDLNLSASTIGTHLYNIKQKLGASNQAELTLIALRAGLIEV